MVGRASRTARPRRTAEPRRSLQMWPHAPGTTWLARGKGVANGDHRRGRRASRPASRGQPRGYEGTRASGAADPERVSPMYSMTTCVDGRRREKWQEQSRTQRNLSGDRPAGENGVQLHVFKGVAGWGPLCSLHGAGPRESCLETAPAMGDLAPHRVPKAADGPHGGPAGVSPGGGWGRLRGHPSADAQ